MSEHPDLNSVLATYPKLAQLPEEALQALFARAVSNTLQEGLRLNLETKTAAGLVFTLAGEKRIYKLDRSGKEITLYGVKPGEMCPMCSLSILSGQPFGAQIHIRKEVKSITIPREDAMAAFHRTPEFRDFLLRQVHGEVNDLVGLLAELAFRRVSERLKAYLVREAVNNVLETTHQAIADELGTSREVISKLLKEFALEGMVEVQRGRVVLHPEAWETLDM